MRWLLTGDWQADENNLDLCRTAHAQEIMLAKKYKVDGEIDLGDLKDKYNPIDARVLEFQVDRWQNIRDTVRHSLALLGNHDRIGQFDDSRNWFAVFKHMGITAVSRPRLVVFDSVVFACLPYIHDKRKLVKEAAKLWEKASDHKRVRRVLLFHCDVHGTDYGLGNTSESSITPKDLRLDKYHRAFGGHIHKRQTIGANAMYVGNPFCFDWGEKNQAKGFVLYDDATDKVEVLPSIIPNWYDYQWLKKNEVKKVADNSRIQATVKCKVSDDYYAAIKKQQERVLARYPRTQVYAKTEFITEKGEDAPILDASTSDTDKIRNFISATADSSAPHAQILKYMEYALKKVSSVSRSVEALDFVSMKARNVLSYKELDFDFRKRGLVLVQGVNKDWPKHSNGTGKTNFLSMIPLALESQTLKGQKTDDWLNEHVNKGGYVELTTRDHKNKYLIHRGRRPSKLQFFINGRDESEDKPSHTQHTIRKRLGFTLETLKSSVYIDQSLPKAFIEGTQLTRTELISKFQNLERFKLARAIVAKDLTKSETHIELLDEQLHELRDLVASTRQEIKAAKTDASAIATDVKIDLTKAKEKLKSKQARRDKYWKRVESKLATLTEKHNHAYSVESEVAKEIYKVTDELDKQKREAEKTQRFKWRVCPKCHQRVSSKRREHMHEEYQVSIAKLKALFDKLHGSHQDAIAKRKRYEAKIASIKLRMNELSADEQKAESVLEALYKVYKSQKERKEKDGNVIKLLKTKLHKAKISIRHTKDARKAVLADKAVLMFSQKAFSRDGIPLYLNSLACPLLNKLATEYSKLFTNGEIQVLFRLNDNELEPVVMNAHGSKTIKGQSSGEMAWAGFITALALRELAPKTNLLVLDEPGFGMDVESAKMFAKKLPILKDKFETILVVTHNEVIASLLACDSSLTIEKEHRISRLLEK